MIRFPYIRSVTVYLNCLNMVVIDKKIKRHIKICSLKNHRSLFIILGSSGFEQIPVIYRLLLKANKKQVQTLWCKKEAPVLQSDGHAFDTTSDMEEDISVLKPVYSSYNELEEISHLSFNLAVLEDFDSSNFLDFNFILPIVKGGGAIVFLFPAVKDVNDLTSLGNRKNESLRFSRRFIQSLKLCPNCLILGENLKVLVSPIKRLEKPDDMDSSSITKERIEQLKLKADDPCIKALLNICLTGDQAELLFKYLDMLKKRTFHAIVSVSSSFGRGKSAALGLAIAGSIALNYSNIFISSSCHSNVNVLFQFLLRGLDALHYEEDKDYDLIESVNPRFNNALIGINVFKDHPQSIRFIFPDDVGYKLEQAELVVIDEAASIPFHKLKPLIGSYLVLMASSTSGIKSTSPYLYDSMIDNFRLAHQLPKEGSSLNSLAVPSIGNSVQNISMKEPIHYAVDDNLELWQNQVFCLNSTISSQLTLGCPETQQCRLFCVSRDALFNDSSFAERFLQSLMTIFNQSNYVIKPEDFLQLADSPDYKIFVLLPPFSNVSRKTSPEVLCAILVHLEHGIPLNIVHCGSNLSEPTPKCFNDWKKDKNFISVQGVHILNIATHPSYKRMGYGLQAFKLLEEFYEGKLIPLEELQLSCDIGAERCQDDKTIEIEAPLLLHLSKIKPERVEFLTVSFCLTDIIFRFWKKAGFVPVFLKSEKDFNSNICFMLKSIAPEFNVYLKKNWNNFVNYYFTFLNSEGQTFPSSFALSFLHASDNFEITKELTKQEVDMYLKPYQMKSLEKYCLNLQDLHCIIHLVPILSKLYFKKYFKDLHIPVAQEAILLSFGLQNKSIDKVSKDLGLQNIQIHGLLNRTIRKLANYLTNIIEKTVESTLITSDVKMEPVLQDLNEELEEAANQIQKEQEQKLQNIDIDISQYAIKGSEDEWQKALFSGRKTLVSIKSIKKKFEVDDPMKSENKQKFKKPMKKRKK